MPESLGYPVLCDFGSAKVLVKGEPNISYICSRYYRAPELIFGATDYTPAIDVWSVGCVIAELLLGQPLFPGESGVDQLVGARAAREWVGTHVRTHARMRTRTAPGEGRCSGLGPCGSCGSRGLCPMSGRRRVWAATGSKQLPPTAASPTRINVSVS